MTRGAEQVVVVFSEYFFHLWNLVDESDGCQKQQKKGQVSRLKRERDVGPFGATQETALVRFDKSRTDESFCIVYAIFTGLVKTGTLTFMTIK